MGSIKLSIEGRIALIMDTENKDREDGEERKFRPEDSSNAVHKPEFVFLGEEYEELEGSRESRAEFESEGDYFRSFGQLKDVKATFTVRLMCLVSSMVLWIASLFMGVLVVVGLAATLATFGQVDGTRRFMGSSWRRFKNFFVIGCGLAVGFLSPVFGLGIVILYFVLQSDEYSGSGSGFKDADVFTRILRSKFKRGD